MSPEVVRSVLSSIPAPSLRTQKLVDAEGRVERFTRKFGTQTAEQRKTAAKAAKESKKAAAKK